MERSTELGFLRWFYSMADYGLVNDDVHDSLKEDFMYRTGKNLPDGYNVFSDGETSTDR